MNNEQQQIIDEVYEKYRQENKHVMYLTFLLEEEFIRRIKHDTEFSEKWGLKIEERELSSEEIYELADEKRWELVYDELNKDKVGTTDDIIKKYNIPTKLITITYKEQTIESYD